MILVFSLIAAALIIIVCLAYISLEKPKGPQMSVPMYLIYLTGKADPIWVEHSAAQGIKLAIDSGTPKLLTVTSWGYHDGWDPNPFKVEEPYRAPDEDVVIAPAHVAQILGPYDCPLKRGSK